MRLREVFRVSFCSFLLIVLACQSLQAQAPAQSSSSKSKKTASSSDTPPAGTVSNGLYRNFALGFTCKVPPAWVLRTEEMNVPPEEGEGADSTNTTTRHGKTERVLLAAFSRPPEARADEINASILIAAESATAYPGLKDAAQYFGPVTEVAKAQGFDVVEDPYEFVIGTKTLARGDFEKNVGSRVMRQSTLVMLVHGYVVSFTFIAGTEDEVEELVQGVSFGVAKTAR